MTKRHTIYNQVLRVQGWDAIFRLSGKQIIFLLPVDYNISQLSIAKLPVAVDYDIYPLSIVKNLKYCNPLVEEREYMTNFSFSVYITNELSLTFGQTDICSFVIIKHTMLTFNLVAFNVTCLIYRFLFIKYM